MCGVVASLAFGHVVSGLAAPEVYTVISDRSRATVEVGKAGPLSFIAGHTHEVEAPIGGTVAVDPAFPERGAIVLEIRTADLRVSSEGEPPDDVPKIQEAMTSAKVLDAERYPAIVFQSTAVALQKRSGSALDLAVTGNLTLHGRTNQITVPVHAEITPGQVAARGALSVKQSDYGIEPVSVGGVVSVKDALAIEFTVVAGA